MTWLYFGGAIFTLVMIICFGKFCYKAGYNAAKIKQIKAEAEEGERADEIIKKNNTSEIDDIIDSF